MKNVGHIDTQPFALQARDLNRVMSGSERRQFGRRRARLHAIVKSPGRPPLACIVRNISAVGALLEFESAPWLPFNFRLIIEADQFEADCEFRHKTGHGVGILFASSKREALAKYG